MKKDDQIYLHHILECIERIKTYTQDLQEGDFIKNKLLQDAVIRNLEVIGEAVKQLSFDFRAKHNHIAWKKIAGMRDKLIHDYIGVDLFLVWAVVEDILPDFEKQINLFLANEF